MSIARDPTLVPLDRAELIELSGADALTFAHAQFASDVAGIGVGTWQWSAWLTAQGRTRCVFALLRTAPDHFLIWLPLGGAAPIREALARFVLRAKVRIALPEGWSLCTRDDESGLDQAPPRPIADRLGGYAFAQPGPKPRIAWLGPAPSAHTNPAALATWRLADIAAGLPWLDAATRDEFVPQALGLERLEALRFDKGCYPGQEIAARLHFRGGTKQRLQRLTLLGANAAPGGTVITAASGNVGTVLYSATISAQVHEALAVLVDVAPDATLHSNNGHIVKRIESAF
jgi:folate-binding protein YgfZ